MKTILFLAALLWALPALPQAFYTQTFGSGAGFPAGWSATDSRISLSSSVPSNGYHRSSASPEASGGNNVSFQECSPNSGNILYLQCAGVISTLGKSNIRIGFGRRKTAAFDKAVSLEYSLDGSDWQLIDQDISLGAGDVWDVLFYDLPPQTAGAANLRFRFGYISDVNHNCTAAPNFRIDDFTVGENASLPVTLLEFRGRFESGKAQLYWSTATELQSERFDLERSSDGLQFKAIASIAAAGESSTLREYEFTDEEPAPGRNYYRLRQVDFDGQYRFGPVISVMCGALQELRLAPVPASEALRLEWEKGVEMDSKWQVFDMVGRLQMEGMAPAETTSQVLDVSGLPEGAYLLRFFGFASLMVIARG